MIRILVESDHFLKILAVMLDPETGSEHRSAVADFFAHDMPDFLSWCQTFGGEIPGLYPAHVTFAQDQADFESKLSDADVVIVESFALNGQTVAKLKPLTISSPAKIAIRKAAMSPKSPGSASGGLLENHTKAATMAAAEGLGSPSK